MKRLETEFEGFSQAVDGFFSPGMDKYNGYSSFAENFAGDVSLERGFQGDVTTEPLSREQEEEPIEDLFARMEQEAEEQFRKYIRSYRKQGFFYPGIEIQRVAAHALGYGVLGRCFPYAGIIQIRNDLYGDEFAEVLTHELTHMNSPHLSEMEVRMATRMKLPFSPRWH